METTTPPPFNNVNPNTNVKHEVRSYFLQQGQSINKLYSLLSSNVVAHHLKKWFSVLLEIIFFIVFIALVVWAIAIPTSIGGNIPVSEYESINYSYQNQQLTTMLMYAKAIIIALSLPVLAFALLLGRNRRKNKIIRAAFNEVEKMKAGFDLALKNLEL